MHSCVESPIPPESGLVKIAARRVGIAPRPGVLANGAPSKPRHIPVNVLDAAEIGRGIAAFARSTGLILKGVTSGVNLT
jgi:hypothetical protein